jgi:hypothetical protein
MGYEELVEAREERAEKDAAQKAKGKGKGKRGRKRIGAVLEADAAEPKTKAARINKERAPALEPERATATWSTVTAVMGIDITPDLWRAPVARMY